MANIRVTCPACKSELEIAAEFEGQEVECGNCLEVFKANAPGSGRSGTGKIPGAGTSGSKTSGAGSRGRSKPAPKKKRRDDDDDDYEHDQRRDEYEDDEDDYAPPPPRRSSSGDGTGLGTTALILGIIAVFPGCCCGILALPLSLGAIITGTIGLSKPDGKPLAVIGLIFGVLSLGLIALRLVLGFGLLFGNPQ